MPGTTRYSATFDRTYEEDDRVAPEPVTARRSRSQSWQANCGTDGRPYTPLAGMRPSQRSSSTDNGPSQAAANIPTRTVANTAVKAHNNPFQFVKVGTCPLYKKAEEQLKKVKEVKKPEVLKEEEEEWQSNLDSWKSRRRKMSEDVFRRQEEIRQLEIDEQIAQANQKKTKTFSEMVESRAHRGRALSLCLISSPLELQNWEFENKSILKSHFSGGSEGNSTVNSEDEGVNLKSIISNSERADDQDTDHKVNGDAHIMNNGSVTDSIRNGNNKFSAIDSNNLSVHKEGTYIDSGLESISSSHRAGDTPDSGSDFSQDSGSSMDCESPRISGVNLLEDYNGKSMPMIDGDNLLKEKLDAADKLCGLSTASVCGSIVGQINGAPVSENAELKCSSKISGSKAYSGKTTKENTKTSAEVHKSSSQVSNKKIENSASIPGILPQQHEKSIESENEMYVDDFDELSKLSMPSGQQPGVGSSQVQGKEAVSCNIKSSGDLIKKSESPKSVIKVMKPLDSPKSITKESKAPSDSIKKFDSPKSVTKAPDSSKSVSKEMKASVESIKKSDSSKSVTKEMKSSESVKKSDSSKSVSKEPRVPSESIKKSDSSKSVSKEIKAPAESIKKSDSAKSVSKEIKAPAESIKKSDSSKSVSKEMKAPAESIKKSDSSKSVTKAPTDSIKKSDSSKCVSKEVKSPVDPSANLPAETKSKLDSSEDKAKPISCKKKVKAKVPKKKITSTTQKTNSADGKETVEKNQSQDCLNIVFESQSFSKKSSDACNSVIQTSPNTEQSELLSLKNDIPPVEKVAEEMEKLILEQLEEEERAKEMATEMQVKSTLGPAEHLIAPPRQVEPPKEKPPPPPTSSTETPKQSGSLKRVNSTKRIKKEIHKRRSDFLGIENSEDNVACGESAIPPPPALEEILKAEMELDRESRRKLESAADQRLTLEEKEIIKKEREIIETLESEERQKHLTNNCEDVADKQSENDRIQLLKEERKKMEEERLLSEEQRLRLIEEKQLREREEYIKKQEPDGNSPTVQLSAPLLSVAANKFNAEKPSVASPVSNEKKSNITSETSGEGTNILSNSSSQIPDEKCNEVENKTSMPVKPVVPPKPLKKKEAIRKERERLRQEQEALQREREEHRRKLMLEQEELVKNQQKSHAPDAPATRLGTLPPLVKPSLTSQLTTPLTASSNARENATFTSRSHHGAQNGVVGSIGPVEPICHPANRQTRVASSRGKTAQNEAWGQQKVPSVRKQNQDSLTESRYNQNHWLIQEAEMRRITELKERQRASQIPYPQTHLAEDDVCSTSPRVPVLSPNPSQHMNYSAAEKHWNYAQPNTAIKNYPPAPVKSDKPLPVYPRESVSHPPSKPSRVVPMERQEQMLSVSGRKRCSHCNEELGRGAAMIIESLQLYYHIHCFQCCVCQAQLGNGSCGTDVRVRNNKLHCHNCYSNDEAGLKFSQV